MRKCLTTDEFIKKSKEVHGDKYDYSKVNYINNRTKVCIICPIHGEFFMRPNDHLNKQGCPKCGNISKKEKQLYSLGEFIEKAKKIHGDKYDYSKVNYKGSYVNVCIICPEHGEFWQKPINHTQGCGCPICGRNNIINSKKYSTKKFIENARKIHGNYYDYSKVNYVNSSTKVCIICPEHGEFWQTPNKHLCGQGCFECSKILNSNESRLFRLLEEKYKGIELCRQYHNSNILGKKSLDIFIPKYNIAIEYQGEEHFKPIKMFGGYKEFLKCSERDIEKFNECKNNNIKLLYFSFNKKTIPDNYIDYVYYSFEDLCDIIDIYIKNKNDIQNIF